MIDTSVLIALERRGLPLQTLASAVAPGLLAISAITASELLVGVHRADSPTRRGRREELVEELLSQAEIVPFDLPAARVHAQLSARLAAEGQRRGAHDLIIAASALVRGDSVVTDNLREFRRVPGLVVEQPAW